MRTAREKRQSWACLLVLGVLCATAGAGAVPAIIPTPKSVNVAGGEVQINVQNRIVFSEAALAPLAGVLAGDIERVHFLKLQTAEAAAGKQGDIVLRIVKDDPKVKGPDACRIVAGKDIVVEGGNYNAVAFGMMTVLQALRKSGDGLTIPKMTLLDNADRDFRALQVSIRAGYHPPEWVKQVVDVMRFYKVRMLELHTAEALWVGAAMESSNGADPKRLRDNCAWSRKGMDDVIAFARERGVLLFPHNEMRPNDPYWRAALTVDFNTNDTLAGYVDEVDGKGKFEWKDGTDLSTNERFWNFLKVATQRSYDQFAEGWPGGVLPYYHIGPVYGEGGANAQQAVRMIEFLKEKNPNIRMMYWNGPSPADPVLLPHKANIAVAFYSSRWGGTPRGLAESGYDLVNVSWTPLYILPGTRQKAEKQGRWIFDEFQLYRFGKESTFGGRIDVSPENDCASYRDRVIGSMLPTWEFASPGAGEGHLDMILPCLPSYAEHAWNVLPYPYPTGAWARAAAAQGELQPLVLQFARAARPPSPPAAVTATLGAAPRCIDVFWAESDNYPQYYQIYRTGTNGPAEGTLVADRLPASFATRLNLFRDAGVQPGARHVYRVKAVNPYGPSAFSQPAEGCAGAGVPAPAASEPFDYPAGQSLQALAGGQGWKTPWEIKETNGTPTINGLGLTYPGLKTSGRSLRLRPVDASEAGGRRPPGIRLTRTLATEYGEKGTQVWSSFLVRPEKVGVGDLFINIGGTGIGKCWGDNFSVYTERGGKMEAGQTWLVVLRYVFHNGNDLIHMWINPQPEKQPADSDAAVVTRAHQNARGNAFGISMQPYGLGVYDVDELRVGATYREVAPRGIDTPLRRQ